MGKFGEFELEVGRLVRLGCGQAGPEQADRRGPAFFRPGVVREREERVRGFDFEGFDERGDQLVDRD